MPRRILLTTFGSLGDLHPFLAIAVELRRRGHTPIVASVEHHRPNIQAAGVEFRLIRTAYFDHPDRELIRQALHVRDGARFIVRKLVMPAIRTAYADTLAASADAELLVSHPLTFATRLVAETRHLPWASTHMAPMSLLSAHDPPSIPGARFIDSLRPLGPRFFRLLFHLARHSARGWTAPLEQFRAELRLPPNPDPLFSGGNSPALVLALFSRVLAAPQPDWPRHCVVTGFPFYDQANAVLPPELERFLDAGEPPIVFTLGSSAVHDAGAFYQHSARAAQLLNRRAVLLTGTDPANLPPALPPTIAAFAYSPYAPLFPRAAAVVHQGGVGTTAESMRAGRPMLIMPYSVDQPDNAARITRLGIGLNIQRKAYNASRAAECLAQLLTPPFAARAAAIGQTIRAEDGAATACDAIESLV